MVLRCYSSVCEKAKFYSKMFSKNSPLNDSSSSILALVSKINSTQYNHSLTPKMVRKVTTAFDSSKASHLDCILVVGGSDKLLAGSL